MPDEVVADDIDGFSTPRCPRWSPARNDIEPPQESARWLVEVHVTDQVSGASAVTLVRALPPPID